MRIGIIWNNSFFSRRTRPGRGSNQSSATANVTLYCTWRPSGLTIGLHGQGWIYEKIYLLVPYYHWCGELATVIVTNNHFTVPWRQTYFVHDIHADVRWCFHGWSSGTLAWRKTWFIHEHILAVVKCWFSRQLFGFLACRKTFFLCQHTLADIRCWFHRQSFDTLACRKTWFLQEHVRWWFSRQLFYCLACRKTFFLWQHILADVRCSLGSTRFPQFLFRIMRRLIPFILYKSSLQLVCLQQWQ